MKHALFVILTLVCCDMAFSQTDDKGIVLGLERNAADAFTKHNAVFLTSAYADNVHAITADGAVVTKQQLLQSVHNLTSVAVSEMQVRIESNVAIITGLKLVTGKDDNGNFANKTRFLDVLLKTKGQWQIIATQTTAITQ